MAGAEKRLPSAARLIAQPRCGHSAVKAITSGFDPAGCRTSQTDPTGSLGYFTQASVLSLMIPNERGTPTESWLNAVSVSNAFSPARWPGLFFARVKAEGNGRHCDRQLDQPPQKITATAEEIASSHSVYSMR